MIAFLWRHWHALTIHIARGRKAIGFLELLKIPGMHDCSMHALGAWPCVGVWIQTLFDQLGNECRAVMRNPAQAVPNEDSFSLKSIRDLLV